MLKTEQEIERDFFKFVKESNLGKAIGGDIYRSEMRPFNSTAEDIVLTFITGSDRQMQKGTMQVDIFVKDISRSDGLFVPDKIRINELQRLLLDFVCNHKGEYFFEFETTPKTTNIQGIKQHLIYSRINFKRLT